MASNFMRAGSLSTWARRGALLLLCSPYLQGAGQKVCDFAGATAEMAHFGLVPAPLFAVAVAVLELGGSLLILSGRLRWFAGILLCAFTLAATLLANRFWELHGPQRFAATNAFFEHLALAGALLLVALWDLQRLGAGDASR